MKNMGFKFAALALMGASTMFAQSQSRITVKVPFNFVISDKIFPAGQYSVSSERGKLIVQDSSHKTIFIATTNKVSGRHVGPSGQIVFHCYDNRCFLSEFWTPVSEYGDQLLPSRYEREAARHGITTEFALLGEANHR